MAEVTRNTPPGFIIDACAFLTLLLSQCSEGSSVEVEPEALRHLRSGRATQSEIALMDQIISKLARVASKEERMMNCGPNVRFLGMCWLLAENGAWDQLAKKSIRSSLVARYPELQRSMICPSLPASHVTAELVAMKYRTVIQKLNKYHELDRSRVKVFKEIYSLLTEVIRDPSDSIDPVGSASGVQNQTGTMRSGDINERNILCLSPSALNRLLDNLWAGVTLVDLPRTSGVTKRVEGGGSKAKGQSTSNTRTSCNTGQGATSRGNPGSGSSNNSNNYNLSSATEEKEESYGIDALRARYDRARRQQSDTQQAATSETAFLRWAGGAAASLETEELSVPLPPQLAYVPRMGKGQSGRSCSSSSRNMGSSSVPTPVPTRNTGMGVGGMIDATHLGHLHKEVEKAVPMMGELEHCMYELLDHHALNINDLWSASAAVDEKHASMGLTVEDIDAYFDAMGSESDGEGEEGETGAVGKEVNVFELLDSELYNGTGASSSDSSDSTGSVDPSGNRHVYTNPELQRHIQQHLRISVASAEPQLQKLRAMNRDTLDRIAKVSEKFSPFEFVWVKDRKS